MKPTEFLEQLDDENVRSAIAAAEARTTGEIRVYVSARRVPDARERAKWRFGQLGMERTADRNAVLLYFAPRVRQFAVIGDEGVHAVCGQEFWERIARDIERELRAGHLEKAVLDAVEACGQMLARHFPSTDGGGPDELPDSLLRD